MFHWPCYPNKLVILDSADTCCEFWVVQVFQRFPERAEINVYTKRVDRLAHSSVISTASRWSKAVPSTESSFGSKYYFIGNSRNHKSRILRSILKSQSLEIQQTLHHPAWSVVLSGLARGHQSPFKKTESSQQGRRWFDALFLNLRKLVPSVKCVALNRLYPSQTLIVGWSHCDRSECCSLRRGCLITRAVLLSSLVQFTG